MCEVLWCRCVQKRFCWLRTLRARGSQSKQASKQTSKTNIRSNGSEAKRWFDYTLSCGSKLWFANFHFEGWCLGISSGVESEPGLDWRTLVRESFLLFHPTSLKFLVRTFFCCLLSIIQNVNWIVWHLCWLLLLFYVGTSHHSMVLTCEA